MTLPRPEPCCTHPDSEHTVRGCTVVGCDCHAPVAQPPIEIRAQSGPQEQALASDADIVILGGSAGGGKSYAILLTIVQYAHLPSFGAVIFRRTHPQLTETGSIWPKSFSLFTHLKADANLSDLRWTFPSGATARFAHMQHANDRYNYDGSQIPFIAFDELQGFEEEQFWYMLARNRDPSGAVARPWIMGTCNPVPEDDPTGGWLHRLVQWWIDPVTGLVIEARSGTVRWLLRSPSGVIAWFGSHAEALASPDAEDMRRGLISAGLARAEAERKVAEFPKSLTFIRARLEDNALMTEADPGYMGRLMLLPPYERDRLLGANWNARPAAGRVFDRARFKTIGAAPRQARRVRAWDKAGTDAAGDWTAGIRIAEAGSLYYVEHCHRGQWTARDRNPEIARTARLDGYEVEIWLEQEPGSGGKESAAISVQDLAGYNVRTQTMTGSKLARAGAYAAQVEAGNVYLVVTGDPARDAWVEPYLAEHHAFDGSGKGHDDQVDGSSLAFNKLALDAGGLQIGALGGPGHGAEPPRERVALDELFAPRSG